MANYQEYINALRKCAKEHENDTTFTGNIIVSDLCRDTATLLEELKHEPALDKIRAEIRNKMKFNSFNEGYVSYDDITRVLDKYKVESEDKE